MTWDTFIEICAVLGALGTLGGGIIELVRFFRKPKACLRFENGGKEIILNPHYYNKLSTKYYKDPVIDTHQFDKYHSLCKKYQEKHEDDNAFILSFELYNNGGLQLEDYRVEIEYEQGMGTVYPSNMYHLRKVGAIIEELPNNDITIDRYSTPQIIYKPEGCPLNQKDSRLFSVVFIPDADIEKIKLRWRIIAKDFSGKGKLVINLKPYTTEYDEIIPVYMDSQIPKGAERVEDLTPYIQQFEELLKQ